VSDSHFTTPATPDKPAKPYDDFPLFAHTAGVWAKKTRGKLYYFGPWANPDAALQKYLAEKGALHAGRKLRESTDGLTIKEMANRFLIAKAALRDAGAGQMTWQSGHLDGGAATWHTQDAS
jgi:hypothetical protein